MKYCFASLLLLATFVFVSCKKDNAPSPAPFTGTWELRKVMLYDGTSDYPPGNNNLLKFPGGNVYEKYRDGDPVVTGTFSLKRDQLHNPEREVNTIRFDQSNLKEIYEVVKDTLRLTTFPYGVNGGEIMDGGTAVFVRIK